MKLSILAGSTSQSINIFISDSSSTTGAGKTALAFNTSGLTAYYSFAGANATATAITLATLAAVTTAWSSGGFKELDATNMPGWYRLDIPNAALATTKGRSVALHLQGVTNMAPCPVEIELTGWDNQDAVHGGMSALPNTACTSNASLLTSGTGTAQLSVSSGLVTLAGVTHTGAVIPTVTTTTTATNLTNAPTAGDFTATMKTSIGTAVAASAVASVTGAVGSVTGLTTATITTAVWAQALSDLAAVPAATASILAGINWMFELSRNKTTQTATTQTVLKDDSSTTLATSTVSDDGTTFTRGKLT